MKKTTRALAVLGVVAGLGVAALPLGAYAVNPADTLSVKASVQEALSINITSTAGADGTDATELQLGNLAPNAAAANEGSVYVNVITNNASGYSVFVKAAGTAMEDGGGHSIPALAAADFAQGTSAWGFKVAVAPASGSIATGYDSYKAVPTADTKIVSSAAAKADGPAGTSTQVTFGAIASATQEVGDYTQTVTFTAASGASTTSI